MSMQCGVIMESNKLRWCFRLKDGLKMIEPNSRLAESYLGEARSSLERAEKNFIDGDLLLSTVVIYYAEYYALYSFLQRIGIKCENHSCSISEVSFLLGENKIQTINLHRDRRIDAQYYMRVGREEDVGEMLKEAKMFVSMFDEIVSNLNEKEIDSYRNELNNVK